MKVLIQSRKTSELDLEASRMCTLQSKLLPTKSRCSAFLLSFLLWSWTIVHCRLQSCHTLIIFGLIDGHNCFLSRSDAVKMAIQFSWRNRWKDHVGQIESGSYTYIACEATSCSVSCLTMHFPSKTANEIILENVFMRSVSDALHTRPTKPGLAEQYNWATERGNQDPKNTYNFVCDTINLRGCRRRANRAERMKFN